MSIDYTQHLTQGCYEPYNFDVAFSMTSAVSPSTSKTADAAEVPVEKLVDDLD
jgi:hypothetical protein